VNVKSTSKCVVTRFGRAPAGRRPSRGLDEFGHGMSTPCTCMPRAWLTIQAAQVGPVRPGLRSGLVRLDAAALFGAGSLAPPRGTVSEKTGSSRVRDETSIESDLRNQLQHRIIRARLAFASPFASISKPHRNPGGTAYNLKAAAGVAPRSAPPSHVGV